MEGQLSIQRDGEQLDTPAIGTEIQNFDLVTTGPDGAADISVTTSRAPAMTVHVSADTQFTVELSVLAGKQQTTVSIIGGSVSLKVAKLISAQTVQVKTDSTSMGVRGTSFTVTAPPTGDVLVTCDEGDVLCTDDQGQELHATPGVVVEKRPGELYRNTAVAVAGLGEYVRQWSADRSDSLQRNALRLITANARLYATLSRELSSARADLRRNDALLTKWKTENRQGRIGQRAEVARERAVLGSLLARMRRAQFQLERVTYRLQRLRAIHDQCIGVGTLDGGVTTAQFFARVDTERAG
ncbi:MAG TPA: FecR family protein, partial [bacterium]|nr:FecR family protein [bacterium]